MVSKGIRVLIGGGTGFIGSNLTRNLQKKGYDVTIVSRQSLKNGTTWEDISKNGLPVQTKYVVNVAGENVLNLKKRWTDSFKREVYDSRINTTRILASAIDKATEKPETFVSISGVGIYPPSPTANYDEETKLEQFDFLSKLCHDWESAAFIKDTSCKLAIVRSGVVLGKQGGMIKDLYLPFSLGLGGPIGFGKQYLPWVHIDDISGLIVYALENKLQGTFNGVAPEPVTNLQFSKAFAKSLNRPAIFPVPTFVFDLLFGSERAKMVTEGQCVLPKKTLESGYKYLYPNIQAACNSFVV